MAEDLASREESTRFAFAMAIFVGFKAGWIQFLLNPEGTKLVQQLGAGNIEYLFLCVTIGTCIGAFLFGFVADSVGRKKASFAGEIVTMVGVLSTLFLPTKVLYATRGISGIGMGACLVSKALYMSELAEPRVRGAVMALTFAMMGLGATLEKVFIDGGEFPVFWRIKIGLAVIPVTALLFVIYKAPESPFWRASDSEPGTASETEALKPKAPFGPAQPLKGWSARFLKIFSQGRSTTSMFLLVAGATLPGFHALVMLSGVMIKHVSKSEKLDISSYHADVLFVGVLSLGAMASTALADRVGRRPLIHVGNAFAVLLLLGLGMYNWDDSGEQPTASFVLLCILGFSQCLGPSTLTPALTTELFDSHVRAVATMTMFAMTFAVVGLTIVVLPVLFDRVGFGKTMTLIAIARLGLAVPLWRILPETAGTALDTPRSHDTEAENDPVMSGSA